MPPLHITCPHCQNAIEVVDESSLRDIVCTSCGSNFSLVADPTATLPSSREQKSIGHFELTEQLGVGAFGTVWKARDTKLDRIVAVKIPRKDQLTERDAEQFFREARAAAQVKHPNIVGVHEIGRDGDSLYIVSDYVSGITLGDWLTGQRPTIRQSAELVIKIAEALQFAHDAGIVHRDLKPSNIMLGADNEPHVMDFGLAKRDAGEITMTMDGQVLGTPAYMSPEQARGDAHTADSRADVFAMGVILFELLTGERPFRGNQRMLIHQLLNEEAPSPRTLNSNVHKDVETVTLKCLEKDPGRRFQHARELSAELKRYLDGEPIKSRPVGAIERGARWAKRNPTVALLSSSLLLAFVAGISSSTALWLRADSHAQQEAVAKQEAEDAGWNLQAQLKVTREAETRASQRAEDLRIASYAADMKLAQVALEENNVGQARFLLNQHLPVSNGPDLRAFEWRYYWDQCRGEYVKTYSDFKNTVNSVVFSPSSSSQFATATVEGEVKIWDTTTSESLRTVQDRGEERIAMHWLAYSPNGKTLATISERGIDIWDTTSWQALSIQQPTKELNVRCLCFSPDGHYLAAASNRGVDIWVAANPQIPTRIPCKVRPWGRLLRFADEESVVAITDDAIEVWALDSGGNATPKYKDKLVKGAALAVSYPYVAAAEFGGRIKLWDIRNKEKVNEVDAHPLFIFDLAFSPDGSRLVSASGDQTVKVWSVPDLSNNYTLLGHENEVWALSYSPDGAMMVSAGKDDTVRLWNMRRDEVDRRTDWYGLEPRFSPDGRLIAVTSNDRTSITIRSMENGRDVSRIDVDTHSFLFAAAGTQLITPAWAPDGGELLLTTYGVHSGERVETVRLPKVNQVNSQQTMFSLDGGRLIHVDQNDNYDVWDIRTKTRVASIQDLEAEQLLAVSNQGKFFINRMDGRTAHLWRSDDATLVATLSEHRQVLVGAAFSPIEPLLVTWGGDNTARLYDASTGKPLGVLIGHTSGLDRAGFSLDGRTLATVNRSTVRLWNVATQREVGKFMRNDSLFVLKFTSSGQFYEIAGLGYRGSYRRTPSLSHIDEVDKRSSGDVRGVEND